MIAKRTLTVTVILVVLALFATLFAGCGSSSTTTSTALPATTVASLATTVSAPTATKATQPPNQDSEPALFPIRVDGKCGYIDKTGTIRIQPQFDGADDFSDGLAMVSVVEDGVRKCGYIDPSGTLVIQPQFADAGPFSEGMAAVGTDFDADACHGYIDKSGALVIPIQYEGLASFAPHFSQGLCVFTVEGDPRTTVTSSAGTLHVNYYGYMDKTGSAVIEARFDSAWDFAEGLAAVSSGDDSGFIDTSGNWVIKLPPGLMLWQTSIPGSDPRSLTSSCSFSEGLAIVWEMHYADPNKPPSEANPPARRCGYIDKTGKVMIEPQFDEAALFHEGLAAVSVKKDEVTEWGYIDPNGKWVIEPQFDGVGNFSEGLATVGSSETAGGGSILDWHCAYIDRTGKAVISLEPGQSPHDFSGGIAEVDGGPAAARYMTYIDKAGKVIWQGD
jgi:hypothetical protein